MALSAPLSEITLDQLTGGDIDAARHLRVAFFSDSVAERNGAGTYYHDLIPQLRAVTAGVEMFQPERKRRLTTLAIPMPGDPTQRLLTPNVPKLWRRFARLRPHVVVSITPGPFGLLGDTLGRAYGCGRITGFHTQFEELSRLYWNPLSRTVANGYLTAINRRLCHDNHATVVNNRDLIATVRELGADHVEVMGTPLPPSFIEHPAEPVRDTLRRVVFAGRLAPEKNLDAVIDAAAQTPSVEFVIAGDGPLRRQLEKRARRLRNVRFTGWLDRDALRSTLDAADLLVLPSRLETFGSIALEAMARGRPALVSAGAGIHAWKSLRDGLIVLERPEDLGTRIQALTTLDASARQAASDRARAAAERLNADTITQWSQLIAQAAR